MVHLELKRCHGEVVVHTVQESHEDDLRVTLSAVTRLGDFRRLANLDDDKERHNVTLYLVETRVTFAHVVLL